MPISFPSNPSLNQTFTTSDGNFFRYNGKGWIRTSPNFSAIASGSITGNLIALGTITGNLLANLSIESIDVANGAITTEKLNLANSYLQLPNGTLAQRPDSPANGMIRLNTSNNWLEYYYDNAWYSVTSTSLASYSVEYLSVAAGGGGGSRHSGGGGAGGLLTGSFSVSKYGSYVITIGAGGVGATGVIVPTIGGNTTIRLNSSCVIPDTIGGGYGAGTTSAEGGSGGSGGGSNFCTTPVGSGIPGQGYPGGIGNNGAPTYSGGGGGGAGGAGTAGSNSGNRDAGPGGVGLQSNICGILTYYAGGGGGGTQLDFSSVAGTGGSGGGGPGSKGATTATNGTTNTGGGGGGAGHHTSSNGTGGSGGSGIFILRYLGSQRGSGGTITSSNGYTIHTFTSSSTYTA